MTNDAIETQDKPDDVRRPAGARRGRGASREHERRAAELRRAPEIDGRKGPDPVRYGDWESQGGRERFLKARRGRPSAATCAGRRRPPKAVRRSRPSWGGSSSGRCWPHGVRRRRGDRRCPISTATGRSTCATLRAPCHAMALCACSRPQPAGMPPRAVASGCRGLASTRRAAARTGCGYRTAVAALGGALEGDARSCAARAAAAYASWVRHVVAARGRAAILARR